MVVDSMKFGFGYKEKEDLDTRVPVEMIDDYRIIGLKKALIKDDDSAVADIYTADTIYIRFKKKGPILSNLSEHLTLFKDIKYIEIYTKTNKIMKVYPKWYAETPDKDMPGHDRNIYQNTEFIDGVLTITINRWNENDRKLKSRRISGDESKEGSEWLSLT